MNPTVSTYTLTTLTGRHIRTATQVTFSNGEVVRFIDRMPKGMAIRQAQQQIAASR